MLRRVFLAGINDGHWGLIKDLHENAKSAIKWEGNDVNQGVRQGGILSTNFYKLYINQLLNMYDTTDAGYRIGNISVNSTACADDVALIISEEPHQAQLLINMACDFAYMEGYQLQPTKSVVLTITNKKQKWDPVATSLTMGQHEMPSVRSATHLGIIRTTSLKENMTANVEENKKKQGEAHIVSLEEGFTAITD
ncbi:uncharacterized protein [Mytilus edulis]|uniref:uncharacterized protein n=1 Tax=Mytilus edulis TaxID=6550 RepID=UPI0039EEC56F